MSQHSKDETSLDCDVVVIGGGIQGVGVAQAAAAKGYTVHLLERGQFGEATSSQSSKLIHGGLRYLETAQFSLVKECLRERQILLEIAPHLVKLEPIHIPIYNNLIRNSNNDSTTNVALSPSYNRPHKGNQRPGWQIRCGLWLYDRLSGSHAPRHHKLSSTDIAQLDQLNTQHVKQVYRYYDAQTDDVALTRAVMLSARTLGAHCEQAAEVTQIDIGNNPSTVTYQQSGREHQLRCRLVINCSGPWVNQTLARTTPKPTPIALELVQGSHLLLSGTGIQQHFYVQHPADKRAIFALPWQGQLLLGTTETPISSATEANCTPTEEAYLLSALHHYFACRNYRIERRFCGIRVLPQTIQEAFSRPRDTLIKAIYTADQTQLKLLTVAGGKLTTYRSTAEKVLQQLSGHLPAASAIANTATLKLPQ